MSSLEAADPMDPMPSRRIPPVSIGNRTKRLLEEVRPNSDALEAGQRKSVHAHACQYELGSRT